MNNKCDICSNNEYEEILLYDSYIRALEGNEDLDSKVKKKLEKFKDGKKEYIRVCHECLMKIKGINRIS